jgi:hypothetical protein
MKSGTEQQEIFIEFSCSRLIPKYNLRVLMSSPVSEVSNVSETFIAYITLFCPTFL